MGVKREKMFVGKGKGRGRGRDGVSISNLNTKGKKQEIIDKRG